MKSSALSELKLSSTKHFCSENTFKTFMSTFYNIGTRNCAPKGQTKRVKTISDCRNSIRVNTKCKCTNTPVQERRLKN